jgi:hypothetical protein
MQSYALRAVFVGLAAIEHTLHALPKLRGDEWLVRTQVVAAVPVEYARVEPIAQDSVHRTHRYRRTALPVDEPSRPNLPRRLAQRERTGRVPFEEATD